MNKRIDVLDGVRAIAIFLVSWLHVWEQSWLTPYISFEHVFIKYLGIKEAHIHLYVRFGAVFVELLILLSIICNFIPYARSIVYGEEWPDTLEFYRKRAIKILPSYYLAMVIPFCYSLFTGKYQSGVMAVGDFLTNLTFTNIFFERFNLSTEINGVLWTVQTEVWIYLFLPLLARAFKKNSAVTFGSLWVVGILYRGIVLNIFSSHLRIMGVYFPLNYTILIANGFLIITLYFMFQDKVERKYINAAGLILIFASIIFLNRLLGIFASSQESKDSLLTGYRMELELCFTLLVAGVMMGGEIVKFLLGSKLCKVFSVISYNVYLWHQWIAFRLKEWRIPYYEGNELPNQIGNVVWQRQYTILVLLDVLVLASVLTYWFEKPVARWIQKKYVLKKEKVK